LFLPVPVPSTIAEAEADLAKIREQLAQLDYQRSVASECGGSLDWSQSSPLPPEKRPRIRQIYRDIASDIRKARAAEAAATKRLREARALYRAHLVRQLIPAQRAAVDRVERAFSELLSALAELDATAAANVAAGGRLLAIFARRSFTSGPRSTSPACW
jgi:hypothetical protein